MTIFCGRSTRNGGRRALLWAAALAGSVVAASGGCRGPADENQPAGKEAEDEAPPSFVRLAFEGEDGEPRDLAKAFCAREFRDTSVPLPYRTGEQKVPVGDDNAIALGDLVDVEAIDEAAIGIAFFFDSIVGNNGEFVSIEAELRPEALAETRVPVVPEFMQGLQGKVIDRVTGWAREVLPLPREHRTSWVNIPENARLDFGLAAEPITQGIPNRNTPDLGASEPPPPQRRVWSVLVEGRDSQRSVIFSESMTSPGLDDEKRLNDSDAFQWRDQSVDLGPWAGQRVRFVFRTEPAPESAEDGVPDTASWVVGNPAVYRQSPAEDDRLNLLLISLDTLRADHLGCYGYEKETSPNLDAFATDALLFERCMAPSSWTMPSHASLFTGLHPAVHRADAFSHQRLRPHFVTLAELAQESGRLTTAYTEGVVMSGGRGFHQGFGVYSDGFGVPLQSGSAGKIFEQGRDWLERYGEQPFFLYLHTYEIHGPYQPPSPFLERFASGKHKSIVPGERGAAPVERDETIGMYDGEIAYTDHVLGEFLDWLASQGLLENTLIVIFSDHGEEFWEHGGVQHGKTLYQEQLHVPLIVRLPGAEPPTGRIAELVSLTDVFATIVDVLGLEASVPASSQSLVPVFGTTTGDTAYHRPAAMASLGYMKEKKYIVSLQTPFEKYLVETTFNAGASPVQRKRPNTIATAEQALADYLVNTADTPAKAPVAEWLFDLRSDPGETANLAPERPEEVRQHRERLQDLVTRLAETVPSEEGAVKQSKPLTDREREQFRALGYLD